MLRVIRVAFDISQHVRYPAYLGPLLVSRMRCAIDFEQALRIDPGIDLRGRKRGMAEQLLDRAQVAAAREKMGRE
jgi:hypothetical protein